MVDLPELNWASLNRFRQLQALRNRRKASQDTDQALLRSQFALVLNHTLPHYITPSLKTDAKPQPRRMPSLDIQVNVVQLSPFNGQSRQFSKDSHAPQAISKNTHHAASSSFFQDSSLGFLVVKSALYLLRFIITLPLIAVLLRLAVHALQTHVSIGLLVVYIKHSLFSHAQYD
ncbi:hypothetical protein K438DRAFT_2023468 [Mycena galopus ATCC 62051]|nr:hypothetical protein K438DRAFT_2023468 [Mycena galopus ATCC 62051]